MDKSEKSPLTRKPDAKTEKILRNRLTLAPLSLEDALRGAAATGAPPTHPERKVKKNRGATKKRAPVE